MGYIIYIYLVIFIRTAALTTSAFFEGVALKVWVNMKKNGISKLWKNQQMSKGDMMRTKSSYYDFASFLDWASISNSSTSLPPDCAVTLLICDNCELAMPATAMIKKSTAIRWMSQFQFKSGRLHLHNPENLLESFWFVSDVSSKSINESLPFPSEIIHNHI